MNLDLTIGGVECVATQKLDRVTIKARPTSLKRPSPASVIRDAIGRNFDIWASDGDCGTGYVNYICADPESFMRRLQTTYGVPMSMFLGHSVTRQDVKYDVEKNGLTVQLTVDGDLGKEIQQYIDGTKSAPDDFRGLTLKAVSFANEQTEIVLVGEYHKFMEAGGAVDAVSHGTRLDTERKEIDDTIEALERDIQKAKERTMTHTDSTLTSTGDNAKLAAQIAASNVALDKMTTLLQQQLANMGIDTSFMSTPAGRSLVKMALPTMIMTMLDLPPVQQNMPKNARAVVRDVVDNAQLAAMADGMQTLIQLFMPLLAEFAQIKGSLVESSGLSVEELFSCEEPVG